jgi:hypothetical protein
MDRVARSIQNKKQNKIVLTQIQPSVNSMREGEELLYNHSNGMLDRYRKQNGRLWSSNMTNNGNMLVDKKLTVGALEYKNSFVHYKTFIHNFEEDIRAGKYYIPFAGTGEQASMDLSTSGFITPYTMTLKKIMLRCDHLNASDDIVIRVEKQDDDATEDVVATATYDVSEAGAVSNYNNFELHTSDFDNSPTIVAGKKVGISIQANSDITDSTAHFWITSVWKTYIEI